MCACVRVALGRKARLCWCARRAAESASGPFIHPLWPVHSPRRREARLGWCARPGELTSESFSGPFMCSGPCIRLGAARPASAGVPSVSRRAPRARLLLCSGPCVSLAGSVHCCVSLGSQRQPKEQPGRARAFGGHLLLLPPLASRGREGRCGPRAARPQGRAGACGGDPGMWGGGAGRERLACDGGPSGRIWEASARAPLARRGSRPWRGCSPARPVYSHSL